MKKTVSLALVALLLLNAMGYYFIFMGLEFRHDSRMVKRFDHENFNNSQLITIQVPLAIPYVAGSNDFERVDGKINHDGEVYRLVKQRYVNDTLTIVCIRDHDGEKIQDALGDYLETFTDSKSDQQSNAKIFFSFIKDFIPHTFTIKSGTLGFEIITAKNSPPSAFIAAYFASIVHPPERG